MARHLLLSLTATSAGRASSYFQRPVAVANTYFSVGIVIISVISLVVRISSCQPPHSANYHAALLLWNQGRNLVRTRTTGTLPLRLTNPRVCRYERLAWIPVLITFIIALGVGGKHLTDPPPTEPATVQAVLSFASTIAGFVVTYSPLSSDYTTYFRHDVPRSATINRTSKIALTSA